MTQSAIWVSDESGRVAGEGIRLRMRSEAESGSRHAEKCARAEAWYSFRSGTGCRPRVCCPRVVPLVRNTFSAGPHARSSSLKASVGTAGTSFHVVTVAGVRARAWQKRR